MALPPARTTGSVAVEVALQQRRSVRRFAPQALGLGELAQLLWAGQGLTDATGHRSAPSAGALYPLELQAVVGQVGGLAAGVYRYLPGEHALLRIVSEDLRPRVAAATHGQAWLAEAPLVLAITGEPARSASRYAERAERYLQIEAGAVAQNVYLQCAARGWATVLVGAFDDLALAAALGLPTGRVVLALMPVGRPR